MSIRNQYKAIPDLISRPHNDLRHIGHVGYDGAVFGDVAFIANDYDKLPLKTSCAGNKSSLMHFPKFGNVLNSLSLVFLIYKLIVLHLQHAVRMI